MAMQKSTKSSKGPATKKASIISPKAASRKVTPKSAPKGGLKGKC